MAKILGSVMTSHVPAIGGAIEKGLQNDPYWKPFFDGFIPVQNWLKTVKPDIVVAFYNDHGLNFFLDKMPTFAVGAAGEYNNADEGWGIPVASPIRGDMGLSWHVIEQLVADEFDITTCQEMLIDHAVYIPLQLMWPDATTWPVKIIPIAVNTVHHPIPSPKRCLALGNAVHKALSSWDSDQRIVVLGTGGLSHQLEGQRAGHINKEYDMFCMNNLMDKPAELIKHTSVDIIELAGSQGVEILNWIAARGALGDTSLTEITRNYHIPISNTAAATQVFATSEPELVDS